MKKQGIIHIIFKPKKTKQNQKQFGIFINWHYVNETFNFYYLLKEPPKKGGTSVYSKPQYLLKCVIFLYIEVYTLSHVNPGH